jgi:flagellar FliJ protein
MKKYRFRLDAVLRVRRIEEGRAAADLAAANRAVHEAEAELDRRLEHYSALESAGDAISSTSFLADRAHRSHAADGVVLAGAAKIAAELEAEKMRDIWSAAAMRVRALERLDERRREEHDLDVRRDEVVTLDEAFAARLVGARR